MQHAICLQRVNIRHFQTLLPRNPTFSIRTIKTLHRPSHSLGVVFIGSPRSVSCMFRDLQPPWKEFITRKASESRSQRVPRFETEPPPFQNVAYIIGSILALIGAFIVFEWGNHFLGDFVFRKVVKQHPRSSPLSLISIWESDLTKLYLEGQPINAYYRTSYSAEIRLACKVSADDLDEAVKMVLNYSPLWMRLLQKFSKQDHLWKEYARNDFEVVLGRDSELYSVALCVGIAPHSTTKDPNKNASLMVTQVVLPQAGYFGHFWINTFVPWTVAFNATKIFKASRGLQKYLDAEH